MNVFYKLIIFSISTFLLLSCSSQNIDDGTTSTKHSPTKINSDDGIYKSNSEKIIYDDGSNKYQLVYSSKSSERPEKSTGSKLTYKKQEKSKQTEKEQPPIKIEKVEIDKNHKDSDAEKPPQKVTQKDVKLAPVPKIKPEPKQEKSSDEHEKNKDLADSPKVISKDTFYYPVSDFSILTSFSSENNNNGIELKIKDKTSIKTAAPGFVIFSGKKGGLDGNLVVIFHNNNLLTIYSNLSDIRVKKGDYIKDPNTVIATASGSLYFELRKKTDKGTIPIDPKTILERRK